MKLSDGVTDCPLTGECKIDIDKIVRCFGRSIISRWHDTYRLVNRRASVKITISREDAFELIERLGLVEMKSAIFRNGSTFRRED